MLNTMEPSVLQDYILWFKNLSMQDTLAVGGKNASLGEMISKLSHLGIKVPDGFAVTAQGYREFLQANHLQEKILKRLKELKTDDLNALKFVSTEIKQLILEASYPKSLEDAIRIAYESLSGSHAKNHEISKNHTASKNLAVAVRSSATAEDSAEASFAGQQETYLNISGIDNLLQAIKQVFASLFNERAIHYRLHHHFSFDDAAISVGVQQMVRSDTGVSGVMFTLDTESGFDKVILINASYGLGELIVQGSVNPDEFYVYKESLRNIQSNKSNQSHHNNQNNQDNQNNQNNRNSQNSIIHKQLGSKQFKMIYASTGESHPVKIVPVPESLQKQFAIDEKDLELLAKQALLIEQHYDCAMDIEWAKDGFSGELYILQARPETVKSRAGMPCALELYEFKNKVQAPILVQGRSVGQRISHGIAKIVTSVKDIQEINSGDILVTDMTDPDWEPIMKRASAIVTNRGGRTCHAAIIAREIGIPAVVGCGQATANIKTGQKITVSCAEGDTGYVYEGQLEYEIKRFDLEKLPDLPVKIMMTIANPERAFNFQRLPNAGVGLARLEFVIAQNIGIHPKACLGFQNLSPELQKQIQEKIAGYDSPLAFYVDKLSEGIATLAAAFWPKPVIVRLSDFKSNEYANLLGGKEFEPKEENPMLGFRGASRYISDNFKACFQLECEALKKVRESFGLTNVEIMIPFVRTPKEAKAVVDALAEQGLKRGENGLRIIMMCEIPSNAIQASDFLQYFDGFSIGSNDLTQLTLGIDRDSGLVAGDFDERDPAVKSLIQSAITACKAQGKTIGICGQGPSDYPDFAHWLMQEGLDSMSLNPDSVIATWITLSKG
jgi:pyruvate,water dikinase